MTEKTIEKTIEKAVTETRTSEVYDAGQTTVIPIIHEEVVVGKRVVETGKVRISKRVVEYEETVDEPLFREEVSVERIPVNQYVEARPAVRQEGETMIIPVIEEQVVVQKRLFLIEELHVKKQVIESHQPQSIKLLKEEVDVIRSADNKNVGS